MGDIYQEIWNADQQANGIQALIDGQAGDAQRGHVTVKTGPASPELRILDNLHIPEPKQPSYSATKRLFDNYSLAERDPETETPAEREEIHDLLTAVVEAPPMQVAREYVQRATGTQVTKQRWYATLLEHWFRQFSQAGDPHLTGFEHVFVGEQEGPKVQGYHFWYKYFLDDGFARQFDGHRFPNLAPDRIEYVRSRATSGQDAFPESVTISYRWQAPDYEQEARTRPLTKKIGGFFVGCSVEGLMALGSVRAHLGARAPKEAVINGARYNLKLFRSTNNRHIRTFYPVFLGAAAPVSAEQDPPQPHEGTEPRGSLARLRIVAARINPVGEDPGNETVTLVNTGPHALPLLGCALEDKNGQRSPVTLPSLGPGEFATVPLSGNNRQAQLSNRGGSIRLLGPDGHLVHGVAYTKGQASSQGETVLF